MRKIILCILDGFGLGDCNYPYNAVFQANCSNLKRILQSYPNSLLATSGLSVGLPDGQMGNSEVGHMTIGAGRIIYQDLVKINKAIEDGSLFKSQIIQNTLTTLKESNKSLHLCGLISEGGVHSHADHALKIANFFAKEGVKVKLHLISDGRDVAPSSFLSYIKHFLSLVDDRVEVCTISGRYYAMDRDNKWDRTQTYLDVLTAKSQQRTASLLDYIQDSYKNNISDEFIRPSIIGDYSGIVEGDIALMLNFRSDRARQICSKLLEIPNLPLVVMTAYWEGIESKCQVLFNKDNINNSLCELISRHNLRQLHIAETEKYAHVTFFLNCGREEPFNGEDRILVKSPSVATYDLQPEMSIREVSQHLLQAISSKKYDFLVCNIANGDMVGHTGNFEACKLAAEAIDLFLSEMEKVSLSNDYTLIVTADHGNLEEMIDQKTGEIHTQHTTGPVPFIVISQDKLAVEGGNLSDIAPTVLNLLDIPKPTEMTGRNLISLSKI